MTKQCSSCGGFCAGFCQRISQEPWKCVCGANLYIDEDGKPRSKASQQEPVAWIGDSPTLGNGKRLFWSKQAAYKYATKIHPLFTSQPKREWAGLTDAEIKEIVGPYGDTPIKGYTRKLFDQIETKLKEKNL